MRSPIRLSQAFLLLCLLFYACSEDDWQSDEKANEQVVMGNNKELTLSVAQQWYEDNNDPIATLRSLNSENEILTKPDWEHAKESQKGGFEVVETPLMVNGGAMFMDSETKQKFNLETDAKKVHNIVRMVVIKNLKTGAVCNFIMIFVGKYDYLKTTRTIGKNTYLHREPDFDGDVYFYKSGQGFVNGWRYEKGKLKATISQATEEGFRIATRSSRQVCHTEEIWVDNNICWGEPYFDEEFGWGVSSTCENRPYTEYREICVWVDDGFDDNDDWYPDSGGGGGYTPGGEW